MRAGREERIAEGMLGLVRVFYMIRLRERGLRAPINDPSYWALWFLQDGDLPISELGRRLDRSKPSMTALIDKLARMKMARRVRDRRDGRVSLVSITPSGREFLDRKRAGIKESIKKAIAQLDESDIDRLCSSLGEAGRIFSCMK